jgi:hypothetical protein
MPLVNHRPIAQADGDHGDEWATRVDLEDNDFGPVILLRSSALARDGDVDQAFFIGVGSTKQAAIEDAITELLARVFDLEQMKAGR